MYDLVSPCETPVNKLVDGLSGNLKSKKIIDTGYIRCIYTCIYIYIYAIYIDSLFYDLCSIVNWAVGKRRGRGDTAEKRWL